MTADRSTVQDWLNLIKTEYLEMPGLSLTKPQIRRLWRLESHVCDSLIDALVAAEFLKKTHREAYILGASQQY
jgi:hypothetical protein